MAHSRYLDMHALRNMSREKVALILIHFCVKMFVLFPHITYVLTCEMRKFAHFFSRRCRHRASVSNGFKRYTRFLGFLEFPGYHQWQQESQYSGGSRIFQMGGRCFVTNGGAHILFSGKKCMKLKEIGLKWGGARLLAPCYSKITIFL